MQPYSFWLKIALNRNSVYAERFIYERILNELDQSIKKSITEIKISQKFTSEQYDFLVDYEVEIIESLLGTGFVLCQTYITNVVSKIYRLHGIAQKQKFTLQTTTKNKKDILRFGYSEESYSPIEIIDAFANYFKHCDEWSGSWENIQNNAKRTVEIIQFSGARQYSSGNLRQGAKVIGNKDFSNAVIYLDKLEEWHVKLIDCYNSEFNSFLENQY